MSDQPKYFEIDFIIGHFFRNGELLFWCKWLHWPVAAASEVKEEQLQATAEDMLNKYEKSIGVIGLTGKKRQKKLQDTAFKRRPKTKSVEVVRIDSHTEEKNILTGKKKYFFDTVWSNEEVVLNRPWTAFIEKGEKLILLRYIHVHILGFPRTDETSPATSSKPSSSRKKATLTMTLRSTSKMAGLKGTPTSARGIKARAEKTPATKSSAPAVAERKTRKRVASSAADDAGKPRYLHFRKDSNGLELVICMGAGGKLFEMPMDEAFKMHPQEIYTALKKKFV